MKKIIRLFTLFLSVAIPFHAQKPIEQVPIHLVRYMPNMPYPYKMKNWKDITLKQDKLFYDFNAQGQCLPLIWWDDSQVNFPFRAFGLPSYVDKNRIGGNSYESLPVMGSLISASLLGIDKSNYNGVDFVSMIRQFFNARNGNNLISNELNRKVGETFWYEIWPAMAYSMLVDIYPQKIELQESMITTVENWYDAIKDLMKGRDYPDFNYTAFDFGKRKGYNNNRWKEPDAAAGLAWLLYASWNKYGNEKYLEASKNCMNFLQHRPKEHGTYYEIMMPYGAYLAVRMNAEIGTEYDERKMLNWCFDGNNSDRDGWGVMCERWEEYDVHGLVGQKKWEQYAFAMNTYSQAAALVPIVKYNPVYAHSIGKWILNLANAARLFYADEHPRNRQSSALWQGDPEHVISYEGLRKNLYNGNYFEPMQGVLADKGPYAIGDQVKTMSSATDICLYGSAWVGMLAAIVDTTNVERILQLDCNATDFFSARKYPTYLLYNPYYETREVILDIAVGRTVDLYDLVSKQYIAKNCSGKTGISLAPDSAVVLVYIPSGSKPTKRGRKLYVDTTIVDYRL
ncbi:MAG: hypothetical protein LBD89_06560 [Tannerellaceae bacterium]|jgi:hypothetical protein|nr:hypothetical protein [Tannerellaceae bacterium]